MRIPSCISYSCRQELNSIRKEKGCGLFKITTNRIRTQVDAQLGIRRRDPKEIREMIRQRVARNRARNQRKYLQGAAPASSSTSGESVKTDLQGGPTPAAPSTSGEPKQGDLQGGSAPASASTSGESVQTDLQGASPWGGGTTEQQYRALTEKYEPMRQVSIGT